MEAEFGLPVMTDAFLKGQDVLYSQFNDINFYIEDIDQEEFYYEIFKKLFLGVKIEKIFPQGGKDNVIEESLSYLGDKTRVFIVDLDFDKILNKKIVQENLFYLRKYSIENYLFEDNAIIELLREERPKMKFDKELIKNIISNWHKEAKDIMSIVTLYYLIVQINQLGLKNIDLGIDRFCTYHSIPATLKLKELDKYKLSIMDELSKLDTPLSLEDELTKYTYMFEDIESCRKIIPGKFLLTLIKDRTAKLINTPSFNTDSFAFRLAKNSSFDSLNYLKNEINSYVNS